MDIKEQDLLGDGVAQHWYYASKAAALSHVLKGETFARILDVGAGSGFFSRHLLSTTDAAEALCVDPYYGSEWNDQICDKPLRFRRVAQGYDADVVLLMDVLEHVDDDVGLVQQYTGVLPRGAKVMITVPAFSCLWSGHDVFLDHKRRYTVSTLRPVVEAAGLNIVTVSYGFGLLFPFVALVRLVRRLKGADAPPKSDLKIHHPWVNAILKCVCALELPFMTANRWMGLSVFCLAEKR